MGLTEYREISPILVLKYIEEILLKNWKNFGKFAVPLHSKIILLSVLFSRSQNPRNKISNLVKQNFLSFHWKM